MPLVRIDLNSRYSAEQVKAIADGIHTVKSNKTRFVVLKASNKEIPKELINKASIKFEL